MWIAVTADVHLSPGEDHIHKLFTEAGKPLGDRFQEIVLK